MKLLIVEDDIDFATALARAMQKRGAEVELAHNAAGALAVAENFAPTHAVVDLETARRIRAQGGGRAGATLAPPSRSSC